MSDEGRVEIEPDVRRALVALWLGGFACIAAVAVGLAWKVIGGGR